MKKSLSRILAAMLVAMLFATSFAAAPKALAEDYVLPEYIEFQRDNPGYLPAEKDGVVYNFYKDILGFGVIMPYIEWNGGTTYTEQLNLRIAAGDAPDVYAVVNGMENQLINDGSILDLSVLRERHGILEIVDRLLARANRLVELVEVLRAFKNGDPNGNGIADEIPTGGREEARWMDFLFYEYGIAMFEGYPGWDLYDGQLTYSAVTPNMRDALQWLSKLYAEGLIDPETLFNDKTSWDGKVSADRVGIFYHLPQTDYVRALNVYNATGHKAQFAILPAIDANGYEGCGFYQAVQSGDPQYVVNYTTDKGRIVASLKAIDLAYNMDYYMTIRLGPEGMYHKVLPDGTKEYIPEDKLSQERMPISVYDTVSNAEIVCNMLEEVKSEDNAWAVDNSIRNVKEIQQYGRVIAGNNIPSTIYEDYEDISSRKLYVEYASKIIAGEWPIEKFDEFVDKWYKTGGTEVTERARAWYANLTK